MGSYLEIDGRETNSKFVSGILIDAIRKIDHYLKTNENSTIEEKGYFSPEYYKKTETEEFGCGDWTIHQKGIALLTIYLKELSISRESLRKIGMENNSYFLEHLVKEEEKEEKIAKFTEDARQSVLWCLGYVAEILADMELSESETTVAYWV